MDFLLLDGNGKPLIVLEVKSESKNPLSAKEQARKYARSQNARFIILSNGNIHYLWDLQQGNPTVIAKFPSPGEIGNHYSFQPNAERLSNEQVCLDYIVRTQMPAYANEAAWKVEGERPAFIEKNKLRFLRNYQQRAIQRVQEEANKDATRFLFEMATGTGKTLTAAALIKLFLRTENAKRVLFLVDRLELEVQADKAFKALLRNDFSSVIYKETRAHYPGGSDRCICRLLPCPRSLPRYSGGSASASSLSRPAQTSLTLRPAGLLNRPWRPLSRGFDSTSYPVKPLVSYQTYRQLSGWILPPLVKRAIRAH